MNFRRVLNWAGGALVGVLLGLLIFSGAAFAHDPTKINEEDWQKWLAEFRAEALAIGFPPWVVSETMTDVRPIVRVINFDRAQPEFTLTFQKYLSNIVPDFRVDRARGRVEDHRAILTEVSGYYGVSTGMIVSLWAIETDFGRLTGGFNAIPALATLAFDSRRGAYFRRELFGALQIVFEGHKRAADMSSSWAGAMGQIQMMPTSFLAYAVDYDGDGRRDVWTNQADVFASGANFLATEGWRTGETWGLAVTLPNGFDPEMVGLKIRKQVAEWENLGVKAKNGSQFPALEGPSILSPDGLDGPAFMVFENFRNILKWNRANYFALAVGILADGIDDR